MDKRDKIGEGIYLLYFAVMVAARAAGLYEGHTIYNISLVLGLLLFACKIVVTRHSIKEYLCMAFFLALALLVYLQTGEKGLIVCFSMMLGMKGVSVRKVFGVAAVVSGVTIFLKIFLGSFGLVSEYYFPIERTGVGLMMRHALGYAHPNTLQMNVLILSMVVMYLVTSARIDLDRSGRATKKESLIVIVFMSLLIFGFNLYVHEFSGSRTGVLACLVFLFFNIWMYIAGRVRLFEKVLLYLAYPFVCFIAIVLPFVLKGDLFEKIDLSVFQTRLSLARGFWSCNSLSLFGTRLSRPSDWPVPYGIDMGQLYLFLQLGIVAFAVISVLTLWFVYSAIGKNMIPELVYFAGMMVIDIWEPLMYNLSFKNYLYVFMGALLFEALGSRDRVRETKGTRTSSIEENSGLTTGIAGLIMSIKKTFMGTSGLKRLAALTAIGIAAGLAATFVFYATTTEPVALYGSREQDIYSQPYIEETLYLNESEVEGIRDEGAIVLDYAGSDAPLYRYGSDVAHDEYRRRAMNIGVWVGIASFLLFFTVCGINVKVKQDGKI